MTNNSVADGAGLAAAQATIELGDETRLVALAFGMSVFTNTLLSQQGPGLLAVRDRFHRVCPREQLTYYATENMKRHRKVTKAMFDMLPTWLQPDAAPREFICIELKAADGVQDTPRDSFHVYGAEPAYGHYSARRGAVVSMSLDPARCDAQALLDLFLDACAAIDFRSALAGWRMNTSRYDKKTAQSHAWAMGMRFRAPDIPRTVEDVFAVGNDGIKGVGWLTALGPQFIDELGGRPALRKALPAAIEFIDLPNGLVLKAGPEPVLGDRNRREPLDLYRQVYTLLAPWIDRAAKRSPSFNLTPDYVERTEAWYHRLADA